jgi:hypothetical protein
VVEHSHRFEKGRKRGARRLHMVPRMMRIAAVVVVVVVVVAAPAQAGAQPADAGSSPAATTVPRALGPNQLRLETGLGAPAGVVALRYSRVLPTQTRVEPGAGIGYTGMLASILVTQPVFERATHAWNGALVDASLELYAGYSVSRQSRATDHAWSASEMVIPDGTYHWLDAGVSVQVRWRQIVFTTGGGVTKLLAGPRGIGGPDVDEDTIWFFVPEGWFAQARLAPALWTSLGIVF